MKISLVKISIAGIFNQGDYPHSFFHPVQGEGEGDEGGKGSEWKEWREETRVKKPELRRVPIERIKKMVDWQREKISK